MTTKKKEVPKPVQPPAKAVKKETPKVNKPLKASVPVKEKVAKKGLKPVVRRGAAQLLSW